jgi:serine protease
MMIVSADEQNLLLESNIIRAYRYILEQRRLYRETNGQKGAFVVAVNLSAGVDFGNVDDFPLWCSIYDSLGREGILSSGAVMNDGVNIDEKGDIPSVCPSPFHVAVTNTTRYDVLDLNAAFGKDHVDLGAPGAVYSTRPNNTYNVFGGTSGAAPQVSAAVALLAAFPDSAWAKRQKDFPESTALEIKTLILNGVDKVPSLDGKSQSGGRLNVKNSMNLLSKLYSKPPIPIDIDVWKGTELLIRFNVPESGDYYFDIFDIMGRLRYRQKISTNQEGLCQTILELQTGTKEILFLRLTDSKGKLLNTLKFNY